MNKEKQYYGLNLKYHLDIVNIAIQPLTVNVTTGGISLLRGLYFDNIF